MASDSPGNYIRSHHENDCQDSHVITGFIQCTNGSRGIQRDVPFVAKDSGYYVSTSDGASTCSSSTTETGESEGGTLLVLEPKSLRSFTTNDEYLYAMKEDLADWFACLYQKDDITADNFFQFLETGVLLCKHANKVQEFARQRREMGETLEMRSYFIRSVPEGNVPFREAVKPETFQARDNVSNFISWGRQLGIPEVLSFETDDLVLRKNEKSVILCLLEIARIGAKLGMLAPTLIQMEQEIDAELAGEEPQPQIQIKTCDMRSLDERVRDLIGRCTCPVQFPMIKVGEGKYKIGDSRSLIFVRILRNHVMVRVGGGWDTLENYLNKHDPCQCNYRGHRPSGAAHKVVVSQQRPPIAPGSNASRTNPNTPTSPRRGSSASVNRSTSPQSTGNAKNPTLVISRHMPMAPKTAQSPGNLAKGERLTPNQNQQGMASEAWSHPSASNQPIRCNSPSPARNRSSSPRTAAQGIVQSVVKGAHDSQGHASNTSRKGTTPSFCSDNEEDDGIVDNDGYFAEDDEYDNKLPVKETSAPGSASLDEQTDVHSVSLPSGPESATSIDGRGKANLNMDKISTMTLAEFKSLLSSSLSANEEQHSQITNSDTAYPQNLNSMKEKTPSLWDSNSSSVCRGHASMDAAGSSSGSGRLAGMGSQPQSPDDVGEESVSIPGTKRPRTPKVLRRSSDTQSAADISRPKTPTSLSKLKTSKVFSDPARTMPKEEYKMAHPKPSSQIKAEATAKVAGAISNLVQVKHDVGFMDHNRPKTPMRPQTLAGPDSNPSQKLLQENFEGVSEEVTDADVSLMISSIAHERPVTPSRIPKPSFIPRPNTPKTPSSLAAELSRELTSPVNLPLQQCSTSNLTKLNIMSANRQAALSRSSSNSSSVKSMDETPVSPASSFSEDRALRNHSRPRRLSNSSDGFSANSYNANTNNSSRSYKDIYTAKRAALSGSDTRNPPTRAVTPGPREKWTLGSSSVHSSTSESTSRVPNDQRRRSVNTASLVDKHTIQKPNVTSQIHRTSSASNIEAEQQMAITNEITFSDDEEINELVKNAALNAKANNIRSASVDAKKLMHQKMKGNEEVLMITRQKSDSTTKFNVVRRTASRGSSKDRSSPAMKTFRSVTPTSLMFQQKISSAVKNKESVDIDSHMSTSQIGDKTLNRTEAWVDSTLPDSKKKTVLRPRRNTGIGNEISASELVPRPLEEIRAILAEPKNGFIQSDARALEAPPEDPEMFRKMEKLFEKYREMEMKASNNETLGGVAKRPTYFKPADMASTKSDNKGSVHGASKTSTSLKLLKSSSGSFMSSSVHSTGSFNDSPIGGRMSSNEDNKLTGFSIALGSVQNQQQRSSPSSSSMFVSSYETKDFVDKDTVNHSEAQSQNPQMSGLEGDQKRLEALQDIDSEVAKNPAALIYKIKELLKVRPRKDENTKVPTRIPAPAVLNKYNRSKSVTNLFSDDISNSNPSSSPESYVAHTDSKNVLHSINVDPLNNDQSNNNNASSFGKPSSTSSQSSESGTGGDAADEVPELVPVWSGQSDSSDNQNRSETPVPKLAMPLTTGRSTLISRRSDKFGRHLSQDKENNISNSQSSVSNWSALSTGEDEAEFV